jgi:hypothetical protein
MISIRGFKLSPPSDKSISRQPERMLSSPNFHASTQQIAFLKFAGYQTLDGNGWLMAVSGEWEKGVDWLKKAIKLNPNYRPRTRHELCFNWFRLGDYEKAYQETLHFYHNLIVRS